MYNYDKETTYRLSYEKFVEFIDDCYSVNDSAFLKEVVELPVNDFYIVSAGKIQRPDLICNDIYGNTYMWWILMEYNEIVDTDEITRDFIIQYPKLSDIEMLVHKIVRDYNITK